VAVSRPISNCRGVVRGYRIKQTWRSQARDAPAVAPTLVRLGRRIRVLRRGLRLTQEQAAARAKRQASPMQP
jgi:hypothetical protein